MKTLTTKNENQKSKPWMPRGSILCSGSFLDGSGDYGIKETTKKFDLNCETS